MAMNLDKVIQDLQHAPDPTKSVALTLLMGLPGEQVLRDATTFRRLCAAVEEGSRRAEGDLREKFAQLRDHLEELRHSALKQGPVGGKMDLSGLGRGDPNAQLSTLAEVRQKDYRAGLGEVRALLQVGAHDRVTAAAVGVLGALGDPATDLATARSHLGHPAGRVRADAVEAYANLAEPTAILTTLGPALGDRHPVVRANAIRALSRVGAAAILDHLKALVSGEQPEARAQALPLLSYLRGDAVLELVRKMAADASDSIRVEVVNILRAHGGTSVVGILEWLAQDKNPHVRLHSARALVLLKAGRGARPGFQIEQLDSVPDAPPPGPPPEDLSGLPPEQAVQQLLRIKHLAPSNAYAAVLGLIEAEGIRNEVLATGLAALAVLGGREDVPRVRPFLGHSDGRVRANSVECIDVMGGRKEILTWLTPVLADPNPRVKLNVLTALGRFGEAVFLNHLQRMIHSPHLPVRVSGAYALAHYPGAAARKLASKVLEDRESEVRLNFAEALATRAEPWAREILQAMAKSDAAQAVREAAQVSLDQSAEAPEPARAQPPPAAPELARQPAAPAAGAPSASPPLPPAGTTPLPPPESFQVIDGLPMGPGPAMPPPSVRLGAGIPGASAGPTAADGGFSPSIDVATDEVLGLAQQAQAELEKDGAPPPPAAIPGAAEAAAAEAVPEPEPPKLGDLVMESTTGVPEASESTDTLGQTFMNFAALVSPGKLAVMKQVQALERERDELLETFGRALWAEIRAGQLEHEGFQRTLFVLKKYLHSLQNRDKSAPEASGGWLGKMLGTGGSSEEEARDPPQLRAQYRNLAKDGMKLRDKGEVNLDAFHKHVRSVEEMNQKIRALSESAG